MAAASYFHNISLVDVEEMIIVHEGFTPDDVSRAYERAYAARFAPSAARVAARPVGAGRRDVRLFAALEGVGMLSIAMALGAFAAFTFGWCAVSRWRRERLRGRTQRKARQKAMAALDWSTLEEMDGN